jgi:hypothetical protein
MSGAYFTLTQAIDVENIQDRDGSPLQIAMLPSFPDESPSKAGLETVETLTTESASALRPSRIRCKMSRHDLATRERLLHLVALYILPVDTQRLVGRQADLPSRSGERSSSFVCRKLTFIGRQSWDALVWMLASKSAMTREMQNRRTRL